MFNRSDGRGAVVWSFPDGRKKTLDNFTCAHCGKNVFIDVGKSASDMGGWCYPCAKAICGPCTKLGECKPLLRQIEEMERRGIVTREVGRCLS